MRFKRLLALLLAAALALSVLLTGCKGGGGESLAQVILNLLDGKYQNVTVQLDPDLEADLRQAANEGETDAEIRAALEKLLGSGVSFRLIGDGQKGDSAWNLILYPGSDPDAAARSAYLEWDKIFSAFPSSGLYTAKLSMIETENGYAILVQATVDKAASRNDDDDEPEEPEEEIPASGYKKTSDTSYKVYNDIGLTSVLFDGSELATDRNSGFAGVTIELAADSYSVDDTFTTPFKGILKSANGSRATINLKEGSRGLFEQIDTNGKVENITFDVQATITDTYTDSEGRIYAGAVAGCNYGEITNCDVTIGSSYTIQAETEISAAFVGGLVGSNEGGGKISGCTVDGGTITGTGNSAHAGGLAGHNSGTIDGSCKVTDTSVSATATSTDQNSGNARAGGLVGVNSDIYAKVDGTYSGDGEISATATGTSFKANAYAGGLVGYNTSNGTVTGTYSGDGDISATATAYASAGGLVGYNDSGTVDGTYSGTGKITAQTWFNDTIYRNSASVPYTDNTGTHYTKTDDNASAGTGIGGPAPVPHTGPSLNPSTGGTTTTP